MQQKETHSSSFTLLAKLLHWSIAALIFAQFGLAWQAENADLNENSPLQLSILAHHKSIGMTILLLMCLRIVWRFTKKPPALPESMPLWQQKLASVSHGFIYLALFILPISGWLGSSAKAFSVSWFSLFSFPDLVPANAALADFLYTIHGAVAFSLMLLVALHILAALKHRFMDKDLIWEKMFSHVWGTFFVGLLVVVIFLTRVNQDVGPEENMNLALGSDLAETGNEAELNRNTTLIDESDLSQWDIDYSLSSTTFIGEQAGAEFEGTFNAWEAVILFDSSQLEQSYFEVEFDLSQVVTGNKDRDSQLQKEPFFFVEQFPVALFTTQNISALGNNTYLAESLLNIKGIETPVSFTFTIEETAEQIILSGQAELDRLEMMIGTGTWTNTKSVGQMVTVNVVVIATR